MKLLLADYFLGFSTRAVSGEARPWRLYYESEEEAGTKPPKCDAALSGDLYVNGEIKEIASTYYPAIGPYDVADPLVAEYHVLLAKACGIDGFMAEFTMGQEKKLLSLVRAAQKHDFCIGVNWISQSHFAENIWTNRAAAMSKARELVRWMAEHVYLPCGVRMDEEYLLMIFLAHPRQPTRELEPFFSPQEVTELKNVAKDAGGSMNVLVLPWENLPDLNAGEKADRVWDGYFPWVWSSSGAANLPDACWSRMTTREQYIQRLRDYYAMSQRMRSEGRIGTSIGAVCPGFDDHKGQAWGEGLKRYLPRDGGKTLKDTWTELKRSEVDAALIITWNDWVESSQIEPSLELGDADLLECARQSAAWKGTMLDERLLNLPKRLLDARREIALLKSAGAAIGDEVELLAQAACAIAERNAASASDLLTAGEARIAESKSKLQRHPIHLFWEYGFDSIGVEVVNLSTTERVTIDNSIGVSFNEKTSEIGFAIDERTRELFHQGHFVGRLCFGYLDAGKDFVQVLVDAADSQHQVIASFKKTGTNKWLKASLEMVNARFSRALPENSDIQIVQRPLTPGGVRMLRIDGLLYTAGLRRA